jgi:hypothetical protein
LAALVAGPDDETEEPLEEPVPPPVTPGSGVGVVTEQLASGGQAGTEQLLVVAQPHTVPGVSSGAAVPGLTVSAGPPGFT